MLIRSGQGQRGVALLLALLIVALAAMIATRLFTLTGTGISRSESQARLEDAYLLSQGMEDFALALLKRDLDLGDGIDTRNDSWARPLPPLPVPGGRVGGALSDLDGRFNLNTLVRNGARDPVAQARFARLLAALDLEPALLDAVTDWIDVDNQPSPQGAEDLDYLRADPPYRAANRPFVHVSELRLIKGGRSAHLPTAGAGSQRLAGGCRPQHQYLERRRHDESGRWHQRGTGQAPVERRPRAVPLDDRTGRSAQRRWRHPGSSRLAGSQGVEPLFHRPRRRRTERPGIPVLQPAAAQWRRWTRAATDAVGIRVRAWFYCGSGFAPRELSQNIK
ncbi:MAG: type II secretion system minor pseudopilin GspK [Rhodanobacteraceae bacterium]|nr:type II secretion system minor pseudopilin GspK [Rhodanobacteraceae bacterium]